MRNARCARRLLASAPHAARPHTACPTVQAASGPRTAVAASARVRLWCWSQDDGTKRCEQVPVELRDLSPQRSARTGLHHSSPQRPRSLSPMGDAQVYQSAPVVQPGVVVPGVLTSPPMVARPLSPMTVHRASPLTAQVRCVAGQG